MQIEEFTRRMMELMPRLMGIFARHEDNELASGTITLPQFRALYYLGENGRCRMKDLATYLHVTPAAATGLIARLMHQGMVERTNDCKDRRIVWIGLSPRGRKTILTIKKQRVKSLGAIFGKLAESDREAYIRILEKMAAAASERPDCGTQ